MSERNGVRGDVTMFFALASCLLPGMAQCAPDSSPVSLAPLEITFNDYCGLPKGRQQVYDPEIGVFHIHFRLQICCTSSFKVTQVADRVAKPIVFRLTGIPTEDPKWGHPLALYVGGRSYNLTSERCDKTLFRVERKEGVTTVHFTEKGQALLKPGAEIAFVLDSGW